MDEEVALYPNFDLREFMTDHDREFKTYNSGDHTEVAINCPMCHERGEDTPDTKLKLWINVVTGFFHCYRCDYSGSIPKLVQKISNTTFIGALRLLRGSRLDPMDYLNLKIHREPYEGELENDAIREIELPYGYQPIECPHPYLEKRGIPWEYAAKHDWGFADVGFARDRIIVPTFMDERLVFWQCRYTKEIAEGSDIKKVLNPQGVSARSVLYNYDVARRGETIVIVEGFIDAVKVGPEAVATNGKRLHPAQIAWLQKSNAKTIILLWDQDAWTDERRRKDGKLLKPSSLAKAVSLLSINFQVRVARLPDKRDPGDYPYHSKELRKILLAAELPPKQLELDTHLE